MIAHLQKTPESKAPHRRKLADLPIGEKLRLLDAIRERAIAIQGATPEPDSSVLREDPVPTPSSRILPTSDAPHSLEPLPRQSSQSG